MICKTCQVRPRTAFGFLMPLRAAPDRFGDGQLRKDCYINDFENGKRRPTLDFVVKIGQYFNVPTDHLIRDDIDLNLDETV